MELYELEGAPLGKQNWGVEFHAGESGEASRDWPWSGWSETGHEELIRVALLCKRREMRRCQARAKDCRAATKRRNAWRYKRGVAEAGRVGDTAGRGAMIGRNMLGRTKWLAVVALAVGCACVAAGRSASPTGSGQATGGPSNGKIFAGSAAAETRDGAGLLRAMQGRYAGDWYETLHFKEKAITHNADGTDKTEVWDEAAILPGKLRIDIGPADNAGMDGSRGMLVTDNTLTLFKNGVVTGTQPFVHMLLVLGFDIYRQPAETTIEQVKKQGFDLSKMHEDLWEGQPVYVVGADKEDLKTKQFWIEKKRLLFVRLIEADERGAAKLNDTRFSDYRKLSVGWVAARVEFYVDGKNTLSEEYFDIQANAKLDAAKFDVGSLKH